MSNNEVEWSVEPEDGNVTLVAADLAEGGDILYFTLTPDGAVLLGAALFDAAEEAVSD